MVDQELIAAGRADPRTLQLLHQRFVGERVMALCIEAMPELILVLNRQRQIIAVNAKMLASLGVADPQSLIGSRPGEVLRCIHAADGVDGCGTGVHCEICGAALALGECARTRHRTVRECLLTIRKDDLRALELEVVVSPLDLDGEPLLLCAMRDISDRKRRESLERLFLHDVSNTVGAISGLAELMRLDPQDTSRLDLLEKAIAQLVDEIRGQKALVQAERGDLAPTHLPVSPPALLDELCSQYTPLATSVGCVLVRGPAPGLTLRSDPVLLRRVLGNLVKNAIEASGAGDTVTVGASVIGDGVRFAVANPAVMPDAVREQLFYRSFSTKGRGRGLGTYGAKLIGERYLGGRIGVASAPGAGTEVSLWLPLGGLAAV